MVALQILKKKIRKSKYLHQWFKLHLQTSSHNRLFQSLGKKTFTSSVKENNVPSFQTYRIAFGRICPAPSLSAYSLTLSLIHTHTHTHTLTLTLSCSHSFTHSSWKRTHINWGFPTRMVYLKHDIKGFQPEWCISTISCSRYTILVGNPRYRVEIHHSGREPSKWVHKPKQIILSSHLGWADGFTQLAGNASFFSRGIAPERMLSTEARRKWTFFKGVVDGGWLLENVTQSDRQTCHQTRPVVTTCFCLGLFSSRPVLAQVPFCPKLVVGENGWTQKQALVKTWPKPKSVTHTYKETMTKRERMTERKTESWAGMDIGRNRPGQ